MAYSYWLTGDATLLPAISRVVDAQQGFSHVWSPQLGFWTERHTAFKLLANVVAYEVTGSSTLRDRVTTILADLRRHQDGANGQVPTPRIDGGLYHTGEQHGDWGPELGASPWMSVLVTDAVVRAYGSGEDAATAQFLLRMGRYMNSSLVLDPEDPYGTGAPALASLYATLLNGGDAFGEGGQEEHSLEVAAHIAWALLLQRSARRAGAGLAPARAGPLRDLRRRGQFLDPPDRPGQRTCRIPGFTAAQMGLGAPHRRRNGLRAGPQRAAADPVHQRLRIARSANRGTHALQERLQPRNFVGGEIQRRRVDAVAQPGRPRPVGEQVAEVGVAARAQHLGAAHAVRFVDPLRHRRLVDRRMEAGPAGSRIELRRGTEQRRRRRPRSDRRPRPCGSSSGR